MSRLDVADVGVSSSKLVCEKPNGPAIAYQVFGDTTLPPVMLVHSIGLDGMMWSEAISGLEDSFWLVVPELRGHGGSPAAPDGFEIEDLGQDLLDLADHLGLERFALVGCSIGANLAMALAAKAGGRLSCVVLANGPAHLALPAEIGDAICGAALNGAMPALARDMMGRWVSDQFREENAQGFESLIDTMAKCPSDAFVPAFKALLRSNREPDLPLIGVPALVVAGELDGAFDGAAAAQMAARIPGGDHVVISGVGHLPMIERPKAFIKPVRNFLKSHT